MNKADFQETPPYAQIAEMPILPAIRR